ncbi:MAG: hypothetical protein Kow0074_05750 [Candidatus Zixiibacteriota bacterium]
MTSSSDRVLRRTTVSERHYRVGEATRGAPAPIDNRPYTVKEVEQQYTTQLQQVREQHQTALEEAYQNGYRDGSAMMRATVNEQIERLTEWIESLTDEFVRTRADWVAENEKQAVELVCVALEHILGERPPVRAHIERALSAAFEELGRGDRATVRCHPKDLEFIEKTFKRPLDEFTGFRKIRVVPDDQIGIGGCLVETDLGIVDARIEKQLAILKGVLMQHATSRRNNAATADVTEE